MITSNFNAILIDNIRATYVPFPLFIALNFCLLTIMNTGNLFLCLWELLRSQRQVISQQKRWNSNFYWDNVDNILYFVCANRIQNYKSGLLIVVNQVISQQKRWNSNLFWLHHLRVETMLTISYITCALGVSKEKRCFDNIGWSKKHIQYFLFSVNNRKRNYKSGL